MTSAEEQKWLIRIILKDMKLGLGQSSVLDTFHPDAKDLYDVTNTLSEVGTLLFPFFFLFRFYLDCK